MISQSHLQKTLNYIKAHQFQTPYMVTDLSVIQSQCHEFKKRLPGVKLYYAVKCFSDEEVIQAIDHLVDGYDIASTEEIKLLLNLGISPARITFSNPVKSESALREAYKMGVTDFAFQSQNELVKIKKNAPGAKVYLRIKVSDKTSALAFSSKFGANPEDAIKLLETAQNLGLAPIGVTFHVGSQATDVSVWEKAVDVALSIIEQAEKAGIHLSVINLGGGFPVQYSPDDPSFEDTAQAVRHAIKDVPQSMSLIGEPGRFLSADSSVIVSTIIGVEEREGITWLFLDVGAFQAFVEIFEFGYFPYPVYSLSHLLHEVKTEKTREYVLTGPSCDSFDTMSLSVRLPADLSIGDTIIITVAGAYTIVYGSDFNGFKVPSRRFIN